MRDMRNGVCALCNHPEVIDAPASEYTDSGDPVRLAVAHSPDDLDMFSPKLSIDRPVGLLRMFVCRSCGFVQWFASKPGKIPVDEAHGTKLVPRRE
jgi:hypothetical protein